eukprot:TRINITY_DN6750_c0_g1_i19.p1 TRINITY_DN6750_c0_g1~~TRINITY_DN6750_c0_g1_i19.p1  ORF type:complete len:171 (-),score=19.99 TRINITY_DN6750_c0_g1_i19:80-592(-)
MLRSLVGSEMCIRDRYGDIDAQPLAQPLLPITGAHDDDVGVDDNTPSEANSTGSQHIVPIDVARSTTNKPIECSNSPSPTTISPCTSRSSSPTRTLDPSTSPSCLQPTRHSTHNRHPSSHPKASENCLPGMYRNLGDATAYEEELEAMKTPAEIEAEQMRLFTEEVMRDL